MEHQKSNKDHDELDSMSLDILLLLLLVVVLVDMDIIKMLLITSTRVREHIVEVATLEVNNAKIYNKYSDDTGT